MRHLILLTLWLVLGLRAVFADEAVSNVAPQKGTMNKNLETATLGGGCFWCVEAVFESIKGIESAESGYSGGSADSANYEDVSSGATRHAEVVRITFDPQVISFADVLNIHFHTHDPTTPDRQGADKGPQYRSVIFYKDEAQKKTAEETIKRINEEKLWSNPIVTELIPFTEFFSAEDYHQDYYKNNKSQPYCSLVIGPKIQKLKKEFADRLKE